MRKATTKAVAVVLHKVWGAKNKRAFMVVVKFGSFLSSSKCLMIFTAGLGHGQEAGEDSPNLHKLGEG